MATPAEEAAALAAASMWVEAAGAQVAAVTTAATQQGAAVWEGLLDWASPDEIGQRAAEAAAISLSAQDTVTQLMAQYVGELTAALRGVRRVDVPRLVTQPVRNGADPLVVHARTARSYRVEFAKTQSIEDALAAAFKRELESIETDIALAARQAQDDAMIDLGVTRYRRVLRPELSVSGSCGLCIAASLNVYTVGNLMPIHPPYCKCLTMPIEDGFDPAGSLNQEDREAAYAEAGETGKTRLSNVRVQVHEHGEYGPVLTVKGQKFTGPNDLSSKDSGGSGGPPADAGATGQPDDDGSRVLPVDEKLVFTSRALRDPTLNPVLSYADLEDRDLLAPSEDLDRHFSPEESAVGQWLRDRNVGAAVRSVRELTTKPRTPDAVLDGLGVTVEFKTLRDSGTAEAIDQAIRRGRGQSRRIVVDGRQMGVASGTAASGIRKALGKYAEDLDEVIVILGDGSSVGWWNGRR